MKKKKLIVGNWKMYIETEKDAKNIFSYVKKNTSRIRSSEIVICPPFPFLSIGREYISPKLKLGVQAVSLYESGAHTGEVSVSLLNSYKVSHVIVGHSEQRKAGENDAMIQKKILYACASGMTPVVCVGEDTRSPSGEYLFVIEQQITQAFKGIPVKDIPSCVVAYEPVWAIGAKEAMNPHEIHEMVLYVKKVLKDLCGASSSLVPILYGGAVNEENARLIFEKGMVDGLLIGRDSTEKEKFVSIIKSIDSL